MVCKAATRDKYSYGAQRLDEPDWAVSHLAAGARLLQPAAGVAATPVIAVQRSLGFYRCIGPDRAKRKRRG
jgi:hypothetical protein